jgi:O-antigen/teichoic acid export membrane protein
MSRAQGLGRGIASTWAGLGLAILVSFFLSPFVVNKLGSIYYGIWALTLQFTGYLNLLDFGMRDSVVRYTSKYVARNRSVQLQMVLSTAALTYLPIIALCLIVTLAATALVPGPFRIPEQYYGATRWAVFFTGLTITQAFVFNIFQGVIQGLRRYDIANVVNSVFLLLRAGLIVLVLSVGYGVVALALVQFIVALAGGIVSVLVSARLLRNRGIDFAWRLPKGKRLLAMARRIFGYGAYSLLHSLGQKIAFSSDAIVVGIVLSVQAVTPYSIAGSLIQYVRTLLASTGKVFIPAVSDQHSRGRLSEVGRLFIEGSKFSVLVVLPIAAILALLGRQFIGAWMGPEHMDAAGLILSVLAVTQLFSAPNYIAVGVLYGMSKHMIIAWVRVGEAVVNVTLSVVLAKRFGLIGVALGTAISHIIVVLFVVPRLVCPKVGIGTADYLVKTYLRPILAAAPFLMAVFWVSASLELTSLIRFALTVVLLLVGYAPCAFFLALNATERERVRLRLRLGASRPN